MTPASFTAAKPKRVTIRINSGTDRDPIGRRISSWGYDINNFANTKGLMKPPPSGGIGRAEELFDDEVGLGLDVLRVPILASIHKKGGYASVGSDPKNDYDHYYSAVIQAIRRAEEAKAPHDLTVFASLKVLKPWGGVGVPRPTGYKDRSLPGWAATLTEYRGENDPDDEKPSQCEPPRSSNDPNRHNCYKEQLVRPRRYVKLLRDYLTYMDMNGIQIDVMGIDNEPQENEAGISSIRRHDRNTKKDDEHVYATIVKRLKENCGVTVCPQFIGPEGLGPQSFDVMFRKANRWLREVRKKHRGVLDYAGTHYFTHVRNPRYAAKLKRFAAAAGSVELWDTEFHWITRKYGFIQRSVHSMMSAFDHFGDRGFKGIVWWDLATAGLSKRSRMQHKLIRSTSDAWPINAWDEDGLRLKSRKLNVRAFKKFNGDVSVWILNATSTSLKASLRFTDASSVGPDIRMFGTRWTNWDETAIYRALGDRLSIPAETITHIRVSGVYPP